jgi:hypothetical protein
MLLSLCPAESVIAESVINMFCKYQWTQSQLHPRKCENLSSVCSFIHRCECSLRVQHLVTTAAMCMPGIYTTSRLTPNRCDISATSKPLRFSPEIVIPHSSCTSERSDPLLRPTDEVRLDSGRPNPQERREKQRTQRWEARS